MPRKGLPALGQDPTTAAEASKTIYSLAQQLGWTTSGDARGLAPVYRKELPAKCSICGDSSPGYELVRLPCGHQHCPDCLLQNYQVAISDPTAFPAKCCASLPLAETSFVLNDAQANTVLAMRQAHEASKVATCFSCEGDIYLSDIGKDAAYCLSCNKLTCTTCKKEMHSDLCPEDPETEGLRKLAKEEGWTQCPKCSRIIQRIAGCNGMVCLCNARFCFRCGCSPCDCNRLNLTAQPPPAIFSSTARPPQPQPPVPPRLVNDYYKSKVEIKFGGSLQSNTSLRSAKTYKEKAGFRLLRDSARLAQGNKESRKIKLKDVKARRAKRALELKMALEIRRLRAKMNDLAAAERAQKRELRQQAREYAVAHPTAKYTVTRRNVYSWDGAPVDLADERPVSKRTRSQNK
ncbi:hypothetical protein TWF696_001564 [Orbilia brochopaga]|uniref:RING-type domain-containing protein n=1 Tax=Orbilia brochopaga TaxID=3140254 RepID=A0AAV9U9B1_9PEZI